MDATLRQLRTPVAHYQGLRPGDQVTVHLSAGDQVLLDTDQPTLPGTVQATCAFGALVTCPRPHGGTFDLYVRHRNPHGHWHR